MRRLLTLFLTLVLSINIVAQIQFVNIEGLDFKQMIGSDMDYGDFDNDGDLDIIIFGEVRIGSGSVPKTYIYRNDGNNIFTNLFLTLPKASPGTVKWGDLDNDGDLDLLITGNDNANIYLNDGQGNFEPLDIEFPNASKGYIQDLNNDGLSDLILLGSRLNLLINKGDSTFSDFNFEYSADLNISNVSFGDYNNDNYLDLVTLGVEVINGSGTVKNYIYKNDSCESFTQIDFLPFYNLANANVSFQDLDSDGDLDLIGSGVYWENDSSATIIYENQGNDNFTQISHNINSTYYANYAFADYDNNGFIDVVNSGYCGSYYTRETHFYLNHGSWNFIEDLNSPISGNELLDIEFGDLDRDNDLDLGITLSIIGDGRTDLLENQNNGNINNIPSNPANLISAVNLDKLTLSWDESIDIETLSEALTYNLYVTKANRLIVNPDALFPSGLNKQNNRGNIGFNNTVVYNTNLWEEGHYFWSVQSIDQGYLASQFSELQEFTVYHNNLNDAPTNLVTVLLNSINVKLSWSDNSSDETNYIIERSLNTDDNFIELAILDPNTLQYTDNNLQPKSEFYYRIKMVNSSNEVGYSNITFLKTPATLSNAPSNLSSVEISAAEISLNWIDNNNDEDHFVIERSCSNSNLFEVLDIIPPNETMYIDKGLNSSMLYFYRLKAMNSVGESEYSNISNATTNTIIFNHTNMFLGDLSKCNGMSWGDFNNDGFEDIFFSSIDPVFFKNNGNSMFTRVTNTGIESDPNSWKIFGVWGDYDNDGFLDMYIANYDYPNRLYHNNGDGTFERILTGELVTVNSESTSASWNDFDNDGDLDIYVTNKYQNALYRNDGDNDFSEIELDGNYNSWGCNWGDYNNDGFTDLYVGNNNKNYLYRNNGTGNFDKITEGQIVNNGDYHMSLSVSWGDYNNDGYSDMLILNSSSNKEWLYRNNGDESFTKIEGIFKFNLYRESTFTGFWLDYDNDGDQDIYVFDNNYRDITHKLFTNNGNDTFGYREIVFGSNATAYTAYGSCYDYNNDGYEDIFINRSSKQALQNNGSGNNWIKISLKGSPSNSFGLGARIDIKANNSWQNRTIRTLGAYHSQNGNILNFGLKGSQLIDSIIISWPMGTVQILTDINVNQKLIIREIDSELKPIYKPSNLKTKCSGEITSLEWQDNSNDEDSFIIERSVNNDTNFQHYDVIDPNITDYNDENIDYNTEYFYRIKSIRDSESSNWSNIVRVKPSFFSLSNKNNLNFEASNTTSISWVDYDNDNYLDLFIGNRYDKDKLFHNTGNGIFEVINNTPITSEEKNASFGVWADYNGNGYDDLLVSNGISSSLKLDNNNCLYENKGGGDFSQIKVGELVNDHSNSWVAAWGDYDKDGYVDAFIGGEYSSALYKNNENIMFNKITQQPMYNSSINYAVWSDHDLDDDLDLITLDFNRLKIYNNLGLGNFEIKDLSLIGLSDNIKGNSINIEDFNNDGIFDIFIANDNNNRLFINENGYYKEVLDNELVESNGESRTSFCGDINNDGYIDIFVSDFQSFDYQYLNIGNLDFIKLLNEPMSLQTRLTSSGAYGDVDNDGKLDLVLGDNLSANKFYLNSCNFNNWVTFKFDGSLNKNIIGTKIILHIDDEIQIREIRTNSGVGSQNSMAVHFGIGQNEFIDYIEIVSPNGSRDKVFSIDINQVNYLSSDYLGIANVKNSRFRVFPNPANYSLIINLDGINNVKYVRIYDISGLVVKKIEYSNEKEINVDLSNIPSGYYFVCVDTDNKTFREKLIIIK